MGEYTKGFANTIYHSAIITGLAVVYSIILKKLVRLDVGDPSKVDLPDYAKLTGVITLSVATKDWLVNNKIIPNDIITTK